MTQKITELTQEQLDLIPAWNEKWIAIGLSTELINREKAEASLLAFFKYLKFKKPKFFYCDGPKAAFDLVKKRHNKNMDSSEFLSHTLCGSMEVEWVALYKFYKDVLGIKDIDQIDLMADVVMSCGWWTAIDDCVYLQERPLFIKMDNENRLHAETGSAIEYRDGFKVYSWHGVRIPGEWIENPEALTPQMCLTWQNIEQRRAACELKGWHNVLKELKAKIINKDADPEIGELLEVDIPEIGKERFLRVLCGTGREFALPVPNNMKTAIEANAWTYGMNPDELMPEVRT